MGTMGTQTWMFLQLAQGSPTLTTESVHNRPTFNNLYTDTGLRDMAYTSIWHTSSVLKTKFKAYLLVKPLPKNNAIVLLHLILSQSIKTGQNTKLISVRSVSTMKRGGKQRQKYCFIDF